MYNHNPHTELLHHPQDLPLCYLFIGVIFTLLLSTIPNLSVRAQLITHARLSATVWTVASQAPLSMGSHRQEYWSGLPFPPPGDLPHQGIKPTSPALAGGLFTTKPSGKPSLTPSNHKFGNI